MTLRGAHLVFMTACIGLAVTLTYLSLRRYFQEPSMILIVSSGISILAGIGLIAYSVHFRKNSSYE